jgi:hypothetical protein
MWTELIIKILKNRSLLSVSVDMVIAYILIFFGYISHVGVQNFLVNPFDDEIISLPLKMPIFYVASIISILSILISKFIFDILCLFSRQFIGTKLEDIREVIRKNNVEQYLKLKRFTLIYSIKTIKNIIYTSSIFLFIFIYSSVLCLILPYASQFFVIKLIAIISMIVLYFFAFIVITRNYFTAISVKDVLNSTKTDGYQSLRNIFR